MLLPRALLDPLFSQDGIRLVLLSVVGALPAGRMGYLCCLSVRPALTFFGATTITPPSCFNKDPAHHHSNTTTPPPLTALVVVVGALVVGGGKEKGGGGARRRKAEEEKKKACISSWRGAERARPPLFLTGSHDLYLLTPPTVVHFNKFLTPCNTNNSVHRIPSTLSVLPFRPVQSQRSSIP